MRSIDLNGKLQSTVFSLGIGSGMSFALSFFMRDPQSVSYSFVAALILLAIPAISFACTCGGISVERAAAESDVIFVGELVASSERFQETTLEGYTFHSAVVNLRFRVLDLIKPAKQTSHEIEVGSGASESACGVGLLKPGIYLIYANRGRKGRLQSSFCMRNNLALCAGEDLKAFGRDNPRYLEAYRSTILGDPEKAGQLPCVQPPKLLSPESADGEDSWQAGYPEVRVWLTIDEAGAVLDAGLDGEEWHGLTAEKTSEIMTRVKGWKFSPAMYQGHPVKVKIKWDLKPRT